MEYSFDKKGWFADVDKDAGTRFIWQPCLQLEGGVSELPIWFESEADCLEFIKTDVIGLGMLND